MNLKILLVLAVSTVMAATPVAPHFRPVPIADVDNKKISPKDCIVLKYVHFFYSLVPLRKILLERTTDDIFGLNIDVLSRFRLKLLHGMFALMSSSKGAALSGVKAQLLFTELASTFSEVEANMIMGTVLNDLSAIPAIATALAINKNSGNPAAPLPATYIEQLEAGCFEPFEESLHSLSSMSLFARTNVCTQPFTDNTALKVTLKGANRTVTSFTHSNGVVVFDPSRQVYRNWDMASNRVTELLGKDVVAFANKNALEVVVYQSEQLDAAFVNRIAIAELPTADFLNQRELLAAYAQPATTSSRLLLGSIMAGSVFALLLLVASIRGSYLAFKPKKI